MRLINTETLQFEDFIGNQIPPYAILSHTWEDGEVAFSEWKGSVGPTEKKGHAKIMKACELARAQGLSHAWVDTCCIDKASSAELSEAINSMFGWYMLAKVCYAYLSDLHPGASAGDRLGACRWFTRGWTLQELIAPKRVEFYDAQWEFYGTKSRLVGELSRITRIPREVLRPSSSSSLSPQFERVLLKKSRLDDYSVPQRLSWAARRTTSRPEDAAYCLLGIFDVNMPLLYGEGSKAFLRLQEELVRRYNDWSILAWGPISPRGGAFQHRDALASGPPDFERCDGISVIGSAAYRDVQMGLTSKGLRTKTRLWKAQGFPYYIMRLECIGRAGRELCLHLVKVGPDEYVVVGLVGLDASQFEEPLTGTKVIHIKANISALGADFLIRMAYQKLVRVELDEHFRMVSALPEADWDPPTKSLLRADWPGPPRWQVLHVRAEVPSAHRVATADVAVVVEQLGASNAVVCGVLNINDHPVEFSGMFDARLELDGCDVYSRLAGIPVSTRRNTEVEIPDGDGLLVIGLDIDARARGIVALALRRVEARRQRSHPPGIQGATAVVNGIGVGQPFSNTDSTP